MATTTKNMQVVAGNANASVTAQVTDSMPGVPCPGPAGYTYKGLRYVPVFADPAEWSSANSYEALTIVLHEGSSYTSKQAVPVGIDISNETFWALTGNYNAQVEQYRQEVKELGENVEDTMEYLPAVATPITKYGAKGDGSDDSQAIQTCLDNENYVFIPAGTWSVSKQLNVRNNTVIVGEGSTSIIKALSTFPSSQAIFYNEDQTSHFIFSDFAMDASNLPLRGIQLKNPYDNCLIRNLTGENFCKAFVYIGNNDTAWLVSQTVTMKDCVVRASETAYAQEELLHFTRVQEMNFVGNKILGRQANIYAYPLMVMDSCTTSNVMECSFAFTALEAIRMVQQATATRNYGNKVIANMFENVGYTKANSAGGEVSPIGYPISIAGNDTTNTADYNTVCFNYYLWNVPNVISLVNTKNITIMDKLSIQGTGNNRSFTLNPYYPGSSNSSGNVVLAPDGNMLKITQGILAIGDTASAQRFTVMNNSGNDSTYHGLQIYNVGTPDDRLTIQNGDLLLSKSTGGNKIVMRNTNNEQYVIRVTESGQLVCEKA